MVWRIPWSRDCHTQWNIRKSQQVTEAAWWLLFIIFIWVIASENHHPGECHTLLEGIPVFLGKGAFQLRKGERIQGKVWPISVQQHHHHRPRLQSLNYRSDSSEANLLQYRNREGHSLEHLSDQVTSTRFLMAMACVILQLPNKKCKAGMT